MTEAYIPQHAAIDLATIPSAPLVEFGMSYEDITDPLLRFTYDGRIGQYENLQGAASMELPDQPIVTGANWDVRASGGLYHRLHAVFNYRGANFGVASTNIDGREFTYVTRFDEQAREGEMVYVLDADDQEVQMYDAADRNDGYDSAVLTLRRTDAGKLELVNESVWSVQVGTTRQEQADRQGGGFSFRNAYRGLKRALGLNTDNHVDQRRWDSGLSANMGWKPSSTRMSQVVRWKRQQPQIVAAQ